MHSILGRKNPTSHMHLLPHNGTLGYNPIVKYHAILPEKPLTCLHPNCA